MQTILFLIFYYPGNTMSKNYEKNLKYQNVARKIMMNQQNKRLTRRGSRGTIIGGNFP
jgi:hypothetical protein